MTDFETHPVGTADLVKMQQNLEHWRQEVGKLHSRIATITDQLTRANASTAAAYDVAAREVECGCGAGPCQDTANCAEEDAAAIRALATPDQQSALDKLIAEAEARVWERAEKLLRPTQERTGNGVVVAELHRVADAILAASKKGGA